MKIGDTVRFLNEEGGGRIVNIKGKTVVVEDNNGFDIPVQINDVIVIQSNDYDISKIVTSKNCKKDSVINDEKATSIPDGKLSKEASIQVPVVERDGGDKLSVYLAFVPTDIDNFTSTRYECYIVNDSNYYISFSYLSAEDAIWTLQFQSEVEPNTKLLIEEFGQDDLNKFGHVAIQLIAYKRNKGFIIKEPIYVQFRIEPIKFYKLHVFVDNDFFDIPAMLYTIVENDVPSRPFVIDAKQLKKEMYGNNAETEIKKDNANYIRRYDDGKHHGNPYIIKHRDDEKIIVVDLHSSELLDTVAGMSNNDILNFQIKKFRDVMNSNLSNKGQKIVFIHGKGEGILRHSIINDLSFRYKKCMYQDASFQEYGYGATQVTIH